MIEMSREETNGKIVLELAERMYESKRVRPAGNAD